MLHNLGSRRPLWYLRGTDTPYAATRQIFASSLLKARLFSQGRPICISENSFPSFTHLLLLLRIDSTLQHVKWKNYRRLICYAIWIRSHHTDMAVAALPKGTAHKQSQDLAKLEKGDRVIRRKDRIIQWLGIPGDRCLASPPDQNAFLLGFYSCL